MGLTLVLVICLSLAGASHGGYLTRREFEADPEASLKFALRSMELGLDSEKREVLRKRAFDLEDEPECKNCGVPKMPDKPCVHGYTPNIEERKEHGCSCIQSYKCCAPPPCPELTAEDWNKCADTTKYGVGVYYAEQGEDCCDCPMVRCRKCPKIILSRPPAGWGTTRFNDTHRYFWCENPCDEAVLTSSANHCPKYICKRKKAPEHPKPVCKEKCQHIERETDTCGHHKDVCKCSYPPQCEPDKPAEFKCHTLSKKTLGYFGCKKETEQCVECFQWIYNLVPAENKIHKCMPCEIEKQKDIGCGSFETVCQCRKPKNCRPDKPGEIPCHTLEQIESEDEQSSQCFVEEGGEKKCQRCYHWNYKPMKYEIQTATCDNKCQFKRPKSTKCGSAEECVCIGKSKEQCLPEKPTSNNCYAVAKKHIKDSYMCNAEDENKCVQCYAWEFKKKPCSDSDFTGCKDKCQKQVSVHTGCDCYIPKCHSTVIKDCEPERPEINLDCYTEPVQDYTGAFSYDEALEDCVRCFNWKYKAKEFPKVDECTMRDLPAQCTADYTVTGKCSALITKCRRNQVQCTETYKGADVEMCPKRHVKVTLKSTCGEDRDACVDCGKVAVQHWGDNYPKHCYHSRELTILKRCKKRILAKKECRFASLDVAPCAAEGFKRRMFFDECHCPGFYCTGCPVAARSDMLLMLSSSSSMGSNTWNRLMDFLRLYIIDTITPSSKLAVYKFGNNLNMEQLQSLQKNTDLWTSSKGFNYNGAMGKANTSAALDTIIPKAEKFTSSDLPADQKHVVVVTDDFGPEGSKELIETVQKLSKQGMRIFIFGLGKNPNLAAMRESLGAGNRVFDTDNVDEVARVWAAEFLPFVCPTTDAEVIPKNFYPDY